MISARVSDDAWATSGLPQRQLPRVSNDVEKAIAERGEQAVEQHLGRVMRNPTGYYLSHVHVVREGPGYAVTDDNVIYGPWLEGVGSRNSPVTRFPGYRAFRRASQLMDREAQRIADRIIGRWIRRNS